MQICTEKIPTREDVILSYCGFVYSIADKLRRRLPDSVEREELVAVGMIGLIEAYDRFDSSKGIPFATYADLRVRGSMIDMLRQQDWVPRSIRRRLRDKEEYISWFQRKHHRFPTQTELASLLKITEKQLEKRNGRDQIISLISTEQTLAGSEGVSIGDVLEEDEMAVDEKMFFSERSKALEIEITLLPSKERLAIEGYYKRGWSLKKIGQELGVTESRACQIRAKAVQRLQCRLKDYRDFC